MFGTQRRRACKNCEPGRTRRLGGRASNGRGVLAPPDFVTRGSAPSAGGSGRDSARISRRVHHRGHHWSLRCPFPARRGCPPPERLRATDSPERAGPLRQTWSETGSTAFARRSCHCDYMFDWRSERCTAARTTPPDPQTPSHSIPLRMWQERQGGWSFTIRWTSPSRRLSSSSG